MAAGLRQFTERRGDGAGEPLIDNENGEDLMYVQPGVSIVIGNRSPESQGTVYISTKKVVWLSDVDRTKGYSVDFLSLSLHAVSREPEAYSSPCIHTQILCECAELNPEPIKDNEEHNWIFSADQLVDEFAGKGDASDTSSPGPMSFSCLCLRAGVKRLLQSTTSGNVSLLFVSKTEVQVIAVHHQWRGY
ncbi:hypothetical protein DKX38_023122 [Salix brachista]|uniref:Chloride conductance regulatory protein ICln n=1 Tax=Salix brachista TaxID=2182728 RepID=A0A5N5K5Y3_9ROSI|nr:hypothetical protein DKX38_023122 [Salix brachista]